MFYFKSTDFFSLLSLLMNWMNQGVLFAVYLETWKFCGGQTWSCFPFLYKLPELLNSKRLNNECFFSLMHMTDMHKWDKFDWKIYLHCTRGIKTQKWLPACSHAVANTSKKPCKPKMASTTWDIQLQVNKHPPYKQVNVIPSCVVF